MFITPVDIVMARKELSVLNKSPRLHQYPSPNTNPITATQACATPAPLSPPSSTSSPSSLLLQPDLPDSVLVAYCALQENYRGEYRGSDWLKFKNVTPDAFEALVLAFENATKEYIRYDYDPTEQLLILRIPEGQPHGFMKNGLQKAISKHLHTRLELAIASGPYREALRSIQAAINPVIEVPIKLPDSAEKRPDIAFYYGDYAFPPLVVEVGHSQKSEDLPALARKYIESTDGDISTALMVDLGYRNRVERTTQRRPQRQGECVPRFSKLGDPELDRADNCLARERPSGRPKHGGV